MIEEYKKIENYTHDACSATNATDPTTNTSTYEGQELELGSQVDDIFYQKEIESE